jgi:hypothetical protein
MFSDRLSVENGLMLTGRKAAAPTRRGKRELKKIVADSWYQLASDALFDFPAAERFHFRITLSVLRWDQNQPMKPIKTSATETSR